MVLPVSTAVTAVVHDDPVGAVVGAGVARQRGGRPSVDGKSSGAIVGADVARQLGGGPEAMMIPVAILAHRIVRDRGGGVQLDEHPATTLPSKRLPTIVARAVLTTMPWRPFWRMVFCVTVASEPPQTDSPLRSLSARRFSVITIPVELTPMLMPCSATPRDAVVADGDGGARPGCQCH